MSREEKNKRKVTFNAQSESQKKQKTTTMDRSANTRLHSAKYTLDSDEEDEEEREDQQKMNPDKLQDIGQERATIGFDDDVKITPFNIDEELEDGHYDETGCFRWKKKDKEEVHDAWLDEIDWTNVKNYKLKNPQATDEGLDESTEPNQSSLDDSRQTFNEQKTLTAMLILMQPGETVVRTIKRLGARTAKPKPREKQRRLLPGEVAAPVPMEQSAEEMQKSKADLEEMSGLADQFVSNGQLDIYQETYERLKSKLERVQSSFDMYGDNDVSVSANKPTEASPSVLWEYTEDEKLQGPFTTEQMISLVNMEGKLDREKVRCRRVGTEQFYSIKRIDFDLYLD